ncbi:hypothetical protein GS429_01645 [Natronorubrum sp. JWXQ-INN-674]|uniref:DUF7974 domain-containing protein n=1 Tax=Natronorubrum halalkaliphilum TaxID=2691917 RepID=A0A6B0VH31_9EURY|nr:hypothetical protein [Natronorubrum halalkaliphilum]MXV60794.1 hypothetical protein [Natronorubrum halalkaliphilum]
MRRIYESGALHRDDEHFTPNKRDRSYRPQALRSLNSTRLSRSLLPNRFGYRAISISVSTPREEFASDTAIPFQVTMKNTLPVPVTVPTNSPVLWTWDVDGTTNASRVPLHDPPEESGAFVFDRGERKQFTKGWQQLFRVSESEWEPAEPGEYTIGAEVNVDNADKKGLRGTTTVRIVPETATDADGR